MSNKCLDIVAAIKYLREKGLIFYGSVVPTCHLEHCLGMKAENTWVWRGPFLILKDAIEREGYFCTQKMQNDFDLKIIEAENVWLHSQKRMEKRREHTEKDLVIVQCTDTYSLDEFEKKQHLHQLNRLAVLKLRMEQI